MANQRRVGTAHRSFASFARLAVTQMIESATEPNSIKKTRLIDHHTTVRHRNGGLGRFPRSFFQKLRALTPN